MSWLLWGRQGKNIFFRDLRKICSLGKMENVRVRAAPSWKCHCCWKDVHSPQLSEAQQDSGAGQPMLFSSGGQEQREASKPHAQLHAPLALHLWRGEEVAEAVLACLQMISHGPRSWEPPMCICFKPCFAIDPHCIYSTTP